MKNIIFDFDGTLLDSFPFFVKLFEEYKSVSISKAVKKIEIKDIRDKSLIDMFRTLHVPIWTAPFVVLYVRIRMNMNLKNFKFKEGIEEALIELSKEYNLYVLTSNSQRNLDKIMNKFGLSKYFTKLKGNAGLFRKSSAIEKFMENEGLDKSESVYVTDELRDIDETKKIDLQTIAVSWGYNSKESFENINFPIIIDHPKNLIDAVKKL